MKFCEELMFIKDSYNFECDNNFVCDLYYNFYSIYDTFVFYFGNCSRILE